KDHHKLLMFFVKNKNPIYLECLLDHGYQFKDIHRVINECIKCDNYDILEVVLHKSTFDKKIINNLLHNRQYLSYYVIKKIIENDRTLITEERCKMSNKGIINTYNTVQLLIDYGIIKIHKIEKQINKLLGDV